MAETPKPKKEPSGKKPKWPLFAAGALAAGAGWYALTGERSKISGHEGEKNETVNTTPVDTTRSAVSRKLTEHFAAAKGEEEKQRILDFISEMRKGNIKLASLVINYILSVSEKIGSTTSEGTMNSDTKEADLETVCRAYGLSNEEYRAAQTAVLIKENLSRLETYLEHSPPGRFHEDEEAIERIIWDTIMNLGGREDPFHPLLLRLLGMNASDLKDRIQEIIAMSQGTTGPFEPHIADQLRDAVKRNYGIQ